MAPRPEHLSMIQAVIARLAGNSFVIKGWSVTLTAALLAFGTKDHDASFAWIALGAAAVFAILDARYLALERKFIRLYEDAVTGPEGWRLNPGKVGFSGVVSALLSWSVALVHGVAMLSSLTVALVA